MRWSDAGSNISALSKHPPPNSQQPFITRSRIENTRMWSGSNSTGFDAIHIRTTFEVAIMPLRIIHKVIIIRGQMAKFPPTRIVSTRFHPF